MALMFAYVVCDQKVIKTENCLDYKNLTQCKLRVNWETENFSELFFCVTKRRQTEFRMR